MRGFQPGRTERKRRDRLPGGYGVAVISLLAAFLAPSSGAYGEALENSHGLTGYGTLKYPADFAHFDYANPDAPKGGTYRYSFSGTFDSLNPFIVIGTPAPGVLLTFDQLMVRSGDEPASLYGLIAESVTVPEDNAWIEFTLRETARWHDGRPITPADVIFTVRTLKSKAAPQFRNDYAKVETAERTGPHSVRFTFAEPGNRALPYTVAQMPVFPKHYWQDHDFSKTTLEPPLASGPYKIAEVDPGRSLTFERVRDYWGKDLPVNRGRFNFGEIRHIYYRDASIAFEAFKAGNTDLRWETLPQQWALGYDLEPVRNGNMIKDVLPYKSPTFYVGYYFNLRRDMFQDRRVRKALSLAFDFEWTNENLFYGLYQRIDSYFERSVLESDGVPEGRELEILAPYRDQLPPELFTEPFQPPTTDGTRAGIRRNLRKAAQLLNEAGWRVKDGRRVSPEGEPLSIEILLFTPTQERVTGPFVANLKQLGIDARIRLIDSAQYTRRVDDFDYDMAVGFTFPQSLSPGSEQRSYWSSEFADAKGSSNVMGIKNPVVDALVEKIIAAEDRETVVAATHALDRVLLWHYYSIPHYYAPGIPIVYWNRFGRPAEHPKYLNLLSSMSHWWIDPEKNAALESGEKQ